MIYMKRFLVLMMSDRCNLSCRYCYADADDRGMDMSVKNAERAIQTFLPSHGQLRVQFSGGEPLLAYDRIEEIVLSHKKKRGIRFAVQTNGLLLDNEKLQFFVENGVGLGLSLDGIPEVNEKMRGGTKRVLEAVERLDALGMGVNVTTVLTWESVDRLPEFLLFCAQHPSVSTINLDLLRPMGRAAGSELAPDFQQIKKMVPMMLRTLRFINFRRHPRLKVREVEQGYARRYLKQEAPYCLAAQGAYSVVTPSGDVYPCASLVGMETFRCGNLQNFSPASLIELTSGWGLPSQCRDCEIKFFCRGGCPVRRIIYTGSAGRKYDGDCILRRSIYGFI